MMFYYFKVYICISFRNNYYKINSSSMGGAGRGGCEGKKSIKILLIIQTAAAARGSKKISY